MVTVQVTRVPGALKTVVLMDDATIQDALVAAELTHDAGYEIRLNGEPATMTDTLQDGDVIILTEELKGN